MRIAVYAIAKNEENNVERWYNSCKDADDIIFLDTGSTDKTIEVANDLGIRTHQHFINPWRFDAARNFSLNLVPEDVDYCLALDLDEYLLDGWRDVAETINPLVDRPKYHMTLISHGNSVMRYWANRMHRRHGYNWTHLIHERLNFVGSQELVDHYNIKVIHDPDDNKDRDYLPLLKDASNEYPHDVRYGMLHARELINVGRRVEAHDEFSRVLDLHEPLSDVQLAEIYRYMGLCNIKPVRDFILSLEYGKRRETYVDLARHYSDRDEWSKALLYFDEAFMIQSEPYEYISLEYAWGPQVYSQAAMAAMNNREFTRAKQYIYTGLSKYPDNSKLQSDLKLIEVNAIMSP
jgi:glycosyltransferase involved in cell wall biosynthesis